MWLTVGRVSKPVPFGPALTHALRWSSGCERVAGSPFPNAHGSVRGRLPSAVRYFSVKSNGVDDPLDFLTEFLNCSIHYLSGTAYRILIGSYTRLIPALE